MVHTRLGDEKTLAIAYIVLPTLLLMLQHFCIPKIGDLKLFKHKAYYNIYKIKIKKLQIPNILMVTLDFFFFINFFFLFFFYHSSEKKLKTHFCNEGTQTVGSD